MLELRKMNYGIRFTPMKYIVKNIFSLADKRCELHFLSAIFVLQMYT